MKTAPRSDPHRAVIMLVDDEPSILSFARISLESAGHRVLTAISGEQALSVSAENELEIDLFVLDVVMPNMSGPALAHRLRVEHPGARFLFTSGYGSGAEAALRQGPHGVAFLRKPFTPADLVGRVDELLAVEPETA